METAFPAVRRIVSIAWRYTASIFNVQIGGRFMKIFRPLLTISLLTFSGSVLAFGQPCQDDWEISSAASRLSSATTDLLDIVDEESPNRQVESAGNRLIDDTYGLEDAIQSNSDCRRVKQAMRPVADSFRNLQSIMDRIIFRGRTGIPEANSQVVYAFRELSDLVERAREGGGGDREPYNSYYNFYCENGTVIWRNEAQICYKGGYIGPVLGSYYFPECNATATYYTCLFD
jgi:hypothetical protein